MNPFRHILVPHDFSDAATDALRVASDLVPADGRIVVLHVILPFAPAVYAPLAGVGALITPGDLVDDTKRELDRTVAKALGAAQAARVETRVVVGDPHLRIVEAARGMDAIVMATAGRTGLRHLVIGSVAEKVVRHSPIPVLTLRAGRTRAATRPARAA